jgi:hypothetical protein
MIKNIDSCLQTLFELEIFIFENEEKFLKRFFPYKNIELNSVYFNSDMIKTEICLDSGQHIVDYIEITEVLTWIENEKKKRKKENA